MASSAARALELTGSAGDPRSPLWILGRDYGSEEARVGAPFVGPAGNVLTKALTAAGLRREDAFSDNIVRAQPRGNEWHAHMPGAVTAGVTHWQELARRYRPKLIVAFGNEAFRVAMGGAADLPSITEARGYLWDGPFGRVLASVHPAAALREWKPWRALIDVDLRKAAAELRAGCPALPKREIHVVACCPGDADGLSDAIAEKALVAIDIENTRDFELACCGFAVSPNAAYVIPATHAWQRDLIRKLCESAAPKVLQNGAYDRYFLRKFCGVELRNVVFDTMLAWHVLQPEMAGQGQAKRGSKRTEKGLRFLASLYTREPYWKEYSFQNEAERWRLNGLDCCITLEVAQKMEQELEAMSRV